MPLVDRVSALKIPIAFICTCLSLCALLWPPLRFDADGEHDWMDPVGGIVSIDNLKAAGNEKARMYIVPRAGHHGEFFAFSAHPWC
jgi:cardiolipin-specific phospholipase